VQRFLHEVRNVARLQHEHVIQVFDVGQSEVGEPFFVMELVKGISLGDLLRSEGRLAVARAVGLALQICEALHCAHRAGIIHRDLKPANVLLVEREDPGDFVKLIDFGISKAEDEQGSPTRAGELLGTLGYMAPEQLDQRPVDARCDLYALGVLLYRLLTGRPVFEGDSLGALMHDHLRAPPPPLRARAPGAEIPEAVEAVVLRCLEKRADDRFESARALAMALRLALDPTDEPPPRSSHAPLSLRSLASHRPPPSLRPPASQHTPVSQHTPSSQHTPVSQHTPSSQHTPLSYRARDAAPHRASTAPPTFDGPTESTGVSTLSTAPPRPYVDDDDLLDPGPFSSRGCPTTPRFGTRSTSPTHHASTPTRATEIEGEVEGEETLHDDALPTAFEPASSDGLPAMDSVIPPSESGARRTPAYALLIGKSSAPEQRAAAASQASPSHRLPARGPAAPPSTRSDRRRRTAPEPLPPLMPRPAPARHATPPETAPLSSRGKRHRLVPARAPTSAASPAAPPPAAPPAPLSAAPPAPLSAAPPSTSLIAASPPAPPAPPSPLPAPPAAILPPSPAPPPTAAPPVLAPPPAPAPAPRGLRFPWRLVALASAPPLLFAGIVLDRTGFLDRAGFLDRTWVLLLLSLSALLLAVAGLLVKRRS
jgi:serine/threonine protein kinase